MIGPSQRPLPDTQHSQQTDFYAPDGIRTHNLKTPAAPDLCHRPRGHWDGLAVGLEPAKFLRGDFKTHIAAFLRTSNYQLRTLYTGRISVQETDACV